MRKFTLLLCVLAFMVLSMFARGETYFKDGVVWKTHITGTTSHDEEGSINFTTIDGVVNVNGFTAMQMYSYNDGNASSRKLIAFVRQEGSKVFFKSADATSDEWYLMYDFGLNIGEGCYVYSPTLTTSNFITYRSYVKSVEINSNEWETMKLEEYADESCTKLLGTGSWIKGLSSVDGVLYNNGFETDGVARTLVEVLYNEKVVYSTNPTSVSNVENASLGIKVDGLHLYIYNIEEPTTLSLYSVDGVLIKELYIDSSARISLPAFGTYLLKIGDVTKKIILSKK